MDVLGTFKFACVQVKHSSDMHHKKYSHFFVYQYATKSQWINRHVLQYKLRFTLGK